MRKPTATSVWASACSGRRFRRTRRSARYAGRRSRPGHGRSSPSGHRVLARHVARWRRPPTQAAGAAGKAPTSARCGLQPTCLVWRSERHRRGGVGRRARRRVRRPNRGFPGKPVQTALVSGRTATAAAPEVSVDSHGNAVRYGPTATPFARHPASSLRSMAGSRRRLDRRPAGAQVAMDGAGRGGCSNRQISLSRSRSWAPTSTTAVLSSTGCRHRDRRRDRNGCSVFDPADAVGGAAGGSPGVDLRRRGPHWGTDVSHVYRRAGLYVVTVSQSDERGDVSTTTTAVRIVAPARSVRRPSITGSRKVGALLTC